MEKLPQISEFQALARKKGVSMLSICKACGVSKSTWQRWKNNESSPRFDTFQKMMDALERLPAKKRPSKG